MSHTTDEKAAWIESASRLLLKHIGERSIEYAESLYQNYVVEDGDDWTPEDAVAEDMNYWDQP